MVLDSVNDWFSYNFAVLGNHKLVIKMLQQSEAAMILES